MEGNESQQLEGLFSCSYCHSEFGTEEHFDNHIKEHEEYESAVYKLKCDKCGYGCQRETELNKHVTTKHTEDEMNDNQTELVYRRDESDISFRYLLLMKLFMHATFLMRGLILVMKKKRKNISDLHKEIVSLISTGQGLAHLRFTV